MSIFEFDLKEANNTIDLVLVTQGNATNPDCPGVPNNTFDGNKFCPSFWDGVFCWPSTNAGETVRFSCSAVMSKILVELEDLEGEAFRVCTSNGTWQWGNYTNYTECIDAIQASSLQTKESVYTIGVIRYTLFIGSILSIACLGSSLWTYSRFKELKSIKIKILKNLMAALMLKSFLWIIMTGPRIVFEDFSHNNLGWICNLLTSIHIFTIITSTMWTSVLGLYLNSKLSSVEGNKFHLNKPRLFAWMFPLAVTLTWHLIMVARSGRDNQQCWTGYSNTGIYWIVTYPIFASMLLNLAFLLRIMYKVLSGIKYLHSSIQQQIWESSKIFLVLFLILGINNLLFMYSPGGGDSMGAVLVAHAVFQSIQGILVSIICCFASRDVKRALRMAYCLTAGSSRILDVVE